MTKYNEVKILDGDAEVLKAKVITNTDENTNLDEKNGIVASCIMYARATATAIKSLIMDIVTHCLVVIDYAHHEMHEGDHYFIKTWLINTGGSGTFSEFIFRTPATTKRIHAKVKLNADADATFDIYRGTIVSADGTAVTPENCDQDSLNTPELLPFAAPTVTTDGTLIWSARNGGGRNPVGVSLSSTYEIIAKTDEIYMFRLAKNTAADTVIDIDFFWYEHTPKN